MTGVETLLEKNTEQNSVLLYLQMSTQKSHCYEYWQRSDSAGHKWYNHCSTLEGAIFPSLAPVKLRGPSGKRKRTVFILSKMQSENLHELRPTPLISKKHLIYPNPLSCLSHTHKDWLAANSVELINPSQVSFSLYNHVGWRPSSFNSTCCPICFLCSIWGWRVLAELV